DSNRHCTSGPHQQSREWTVETARFRRIVQCSHVLSTGPTLGPVLPVPTACVSTNQPQQPLAARLPGAARPESAMAVTPRIERELRCSRCGTWVPVTSSDLLRCSCTKEWPRCCGLIMSLVVVETRPAESRRPAEN